MNKNNNTKNIVNQIKAELTNIIKVKYADKYLEVCSLINKRLDDFIAVFRKHYPENFPKQLIGLTNDTKIELKWRESYASLVLEIPNILTQGNEEFKISHIV